MAQEYWYDASSTKTALKALDGAYKDVMTAALKIGKTLKKYVCVTKKWNDDNAETFASWWNQNGKGGGAGGSLKWDEKGKQLYMSKQDGSQSDGEDKIRHVVSMCGALYWLVTCNAFNALSSSYSKEMKKYNNYISVAKNSTYKTKFSKKDYTGTTWMKMMSSNFNAPKWETTTLKKEKSGSVTSAEALKSLANDLAANLKDLNTKVDTFIDKVKNIEGNSRSDKYWGFSDELASEIHTAARELNTNTVRWLKSFASNTNLALSTANNAVKKDLASLSKIKFN